MCGQGKPLNACRRYPLRKFIEWTYQMGLILHKIQSEKQWVAKNLLNEPTWKACFYTRFGLRNSRRWLQDHNLTRLTFACGCNLLGICLIGHRHRHGHGALLVKYRLQWKHKFNGIPWMRTVNKNFKRHLKKENFTFPFTKDLKDFLLFKTSFIT